MATITFDITVETNAIVTFAITRITMTLENNKIFILGAGASRELKFNSTNIDIGQITVKVL